VARDWLISLPVWGKDYRKRFVQDCWPSVSIALGAVHGNLRIVLHTDAPELARLFRPYDVCVKELTHEGHSTLSAAQREVLALAEPGEAIAFLAADVICSRECFAAAERRFDEGYRAVVCAGTRTVGPIFNAKAPAGWSARELLGWTMDFAHPIVQQCVYPHGQNAIPSTIYFRDDSNIILRAFHLHPFAVLKQGKLDFTCTIDRDLVDSFPLDQVHVVTDADDMALAEITPIGKRQALLPYAMTHDYIAWWINHYGTARHKQFFARRIVIRGSAETDCDKPADAILEVVNGA